jgi:hypothetical protein
MASQDGNDSKGVFDGIDQAPLNRELAARRYPAPAAARAARTFARPAGGLARISDADFARLQEQACTANRGPRWSHSEF